MLQNIMNKNLVYKFAFQNNFVDLSSFQIYIIKFF